jgi:hypothetical protein
VRHVPSWTAPLAWRDVGHDLTRMLRAGMPADWPAGERVIALLVADTCNDATRTGYFAGGIEQLAAESGMTTASVSNTLRRLAKRGYEMRVTHRIGKDGRPVVAASGHSTDFRMPILPPRPQKGPSVDGPSGETPEGPGERKGHPRVEKGPSTSGKRAIRGWAPLPKHSLPPPKVKTSNTSPAQPQLETRTCTRAEQDEIERQRQMDGLVTGGYMTDGAQGRRTVASHQSAPELSEDRAAPELRPDKPG